MLGSRSFERIFIISTHQVRDVDSLIDPITILHCGKVLFNYGMAELLERIHMRHSTAPPKQNAPGLIHFEANVAGYWSVWQGPDDLGGPIDLEILFNAVISHPELYLSESKGALV